MKRNMKAVFIGAVLTFVGIAAIFVTRSAAIASDAEVRAKVLYTISLIAVLMGIVVFTAGFVPPARKADTKLLTMAAMMAALCYIGFAFFKIDIPVPGTDASTAFHLGNVFCVLAALLLGGLWGGIAGALGMTTGDLFDARYITSAPKTFLLKLCIGLIVGLFAHRIFRIREETDKRALTWKTFLSCAAGMAFNVVADPLTGYFYKRYLFGLPQDFAAALAKLSAVTTLFNAVIAVAVSGVLYLALRPALNKAGILR